MFKKVLCFSLFLLIFCIPTNALAANEVCFSLADANTEKNRLFETTLSTDSEVAAFVATLSFDENALEFKEAKTLWDTAEISVNSSEKGSVRLAYLCEGGTKGELIALTFKAKTQSTQITLSLEQVIDKNAADLSASVKKDTNITVLSKAAEDDKTKDTKADFTQGYNSDSVTKPTAQNANESIEVKAENEADISLVTGVILFALVMFAVAGAAFFLGKNTNKNKYGRKN
ncbi:MAG: cohesin domain-containing protein [Ruminococcus sp.]|nr:cohesin domain-containing protein [Ruminococcus sp.]